MTRNQILLIIAGILGVTLLYFFSDLDGPEKDTDALKGTQVTESTFDIDPIVTTMIDTMVSPLREEVLKYKAIAEGNENELVPSALDSLKKYFLSIPNRALFSIYNEKSAELNNTVKGWDNAGDMYYRAFFDHREKTELAAYFADKSLECYDKALSIDSENLDLPVKKAGVFFDTKNDVMSGVKLLLDVIDKDPLHIEANMLLGKYGMVSGQYRKALSRIQNVLKADSQDVEAYLYLAEIYERLERPDSAILMLKAGQGLVKDPELKVELQNYIDVISVTSKK